MKDKLSNSGHVGKKAKEFSTCLKNSAIQHLIKDKLRNSAQVGKKAKEFSTCLKKFSYSALAKR